MKKRLLLLVLLTIPSFYALLKPGFYQSLDGINNASRLAAFHQSLVSGQLIPRWAANLNFGFGHPVLIFQYPLPNYLGSLFHLIGFSFTDSIKIVLILSAILSAVFFYLWNSQIIDKKASLIGALLYTYAPYKFVDIYVRNSWGEVLALTILPLVLYLVEKVRQGKKAALFSLPLSFALLILSHNIISLMSVPLIACYIFLRGNLRDRKRRLNSAMIILVLLLGLLLSAFFWMPALLEARYTTRDLMVGNMYQNHFPTLSQIFYSPWGYGISKPGPSDDMSFMLGLGQWIAIILALFSLSIKSIKNETRAILLFLLGVFFVSVFLMLEQSNFIWKALPLLSQFQFPWRFLSLSVFASAACGAISFDALTRKISPKKSLAALVVLTFLIILSNKDFMVPKGPVDYKDTELLNYRGTTTWFGENNTIWTAGEQKDFAKERLEITEGSASIKNIKLNPTSHIYEVDNSKEVKLVDNTVYFPGWTVLDNGKKTQIEFQNTNYRGLITFSSPPGSHKIEVIFRETKIRQIADLISLGSLLLLILLFKKAPEIKTAEKNKDRA